MFLRYISAYTYLCHEVTRNRIRRSPRESQCQFDPKRIPIDNLGSCVRTRVRQQLTLHTENEIIFNKHKLKNKTKETITTEN